MISNTPPNIRIDQITNYIKGMAEQKAAMQLAGCVWCLSNQNHKNASIISVVEGNAGVDNGASLLKQKNVKSDSYIIQWDANNINEDDLLNSVHGDEATEFGAEGIALVLAAMRTGKNVIQRAEKTKGGGFDYWMKDEGSFLFQSSIRVEISGILKENASTGNTIKRRVAEKLKQVSNSDKAYSTIKGCAIVVEFNKLVVKMVWNNVQ